jgi:hypothetical protein
VGLAALELALGLGLGDAFTLAFWHDLTLEFSNRIKQIEHQLASRCSLPAWVLPSTTLTQFPPL